MHKKAISKPMKENELVARKRENRSGFKKKSGRNRGVCVRMTYFSGF